MIVKKNINSRSVAKKGTELSFYSIRVALNVGLSNTHREEPCEEKKEIGLKHLPGKEWRYPPNAKRTFQTSSLQNLRQ